MPNWDHVLKEIAKEKDEPNQSAADKVRQKYLMQLFGKTGRNIICYYSGFLSKPSVEGVEITDEDKNGFMLCVHKLQKSKGLDLFIHTPGGSGAATASLIHYLKQMFGNDIRAFVPQIAMSAGTIMACACKEIYMGKHSNIGPVDPQINGLPAYGVVSELETAFKEIMADNNKQYIWNPILSRYTPSFVQQCQWSIEASKKFVGEFLEANMFADLEESERRRLVGTITDQLSDLRANKGHDKHIHYEECEAMGLKVKRLEDEDIQDLVLTIHHCYMFALSNSGAFKMVENHLGRRFIKVQIQSLQPAQNFNLPPELVTAMMQELKSGKSS
jgi:ClpP class serine protease